ncbi:MAG: non-homologous end-joining DNA ligase [Actinomycetota bacterium]
MEVSNPDKVLFPSAGITKLQVVEHYRLVGSAMLRFASRRPLTLQRFPQGIERKGFMQKNAAAHFPESIERHLVPKRDGGETAYPVVTDPGDVAWLANQNTITFHMWLTTVDRPSEADWLVIDLDPPEDQVDAVRSAARVVRALLARHDLAGVPVATGSKGYHVWVPLTPGTTTGAAALAARALAGLAASEHPDDLTVEFLKRERRGRVFVDWLRNTPTATTVVPFSLRARPGAPVAMPMAWDELEESAPDRWRLGGVADRLDAVPVPAAQHLPVDRIVDAARAAGVDLETPHDRFGRRR